MMKTKDTEFKVRLLETIKNGGGDTFKNGLIVMAKKSYGGYTLTKMHRTKRSVIGGTNGEFFYTRESVTRVNEKSFERI